MKVDRQRVGTVDVLSPIGALADADADGFAGVLRSRLDAVNPRLVVDMHEVPYMDSIALEKFLDVAEDLQSRGAHLKLCAASPTCREILELTGLASSFQFFDSIEDAVRSFL